MLIFYKQLLKTAANIAAGATVLLVSAPAIAMGQQVAESNIQRLSLRGSQHVQSSKQRRRRPRRARPRPPRSLPPNQVQPGGGLDASVQACESQMEALTALVPVENPVYTTSAHPTFLFYFPDAPESIKYAEFIVLSADEKEQIYAAQFVPDEKGIVSISLPEGSSAGLAVDQPYHWYLNMHCVTTADVPSVNGWVQRVADEGSARNNSLHALSEMTVGADREGDVVLPEIWYDAIAQMATSIRVLQSAEIVRIGVSDRALQAQWSAWLTAIGLEELVDQPIIGPVTSQDVTASRL